MNLVITSEQRVGSRWMHYLLADLLGKGTSPEIDANRFYKNLDEVLNTVKGYLKDNRIPKFHGIGAVALDRFFKSNGLKDVGIMGVVRNPYDRAVSLAFHNRYHKNFDGFKQKKFETDEEAVIWTAIQDGGFEKSNVRQISELMLPFHSTFSNRVNTYDYVWTTYEWLKEDTEGEIQAVLRTLFRGSVIPRQQLIKTFVDKHSFENKSGREEGKEKRNDLWRRKGIVGDYKNWFTDECYEVLEPHYNRYIWTVEYEKQGDYYKKPII